MFIRNCWYVIAWEHEIGTDALFSRRVLDEPILVYRTSNGALAALEDRCCHRLAPLSLGRKEGDCVRCGYHGLKFDASGRCIDVPGLTLLNRWDAALIRFRRLIDSELKKERAPQVKRRGKLSAEPAPAPLPSRARGRGK